MGYRFFNTCQILADDVGSLPAQGSFKGQFAYVDSTDEVYAWDGAAWDLIGPSSSAGAAPDNADYLVKTANGSLSAERVVGDSTTVTANWATPGAVSFERAALSGDVAAAANSNTTAIGNDKITEPMLKAVNGPTDEYPLTYESTTGDFEWQQLTTAGIADDAVTPAKLDNGAALTVLGRSPNSSGDRADIAGSTVGHVLQVLAGPTVGFGSVATATGKYNPDTTPLSGTWGDEEFTGGAEQLTWRWGNQGSSTITFHNDVATLFTPNSTTNHRVRWTTPPTGSFSFATKLWRHATVPSSTSGVVVLETGSEATPTLFSGYFIQAKATSTWGNISAYTRTSYTSAYTSGSNDDTAAGGYYGMSHYFLTTYDSATKVLRHFFSYDGYGFQSRTSSPYKRTLGADPISIGFFVDANNNTATSGHLVGCQFFRIWDSVITTDFLTDQLTRATIGA